MGGSVVANAEVVSSLWPVLIQWLKKVSQCFGIFERMTWHKSGKLSNNLKIIPVIVHHPGFLTSPRPCDSG